MKSPSNRGFALFFGLAGLLCAGYFFWPPGRAFLSPPMFAVNMGAVLMTGLSAYLPQPFLAGIGNGLSGVMRPFFTQKVLWKCAVAGGCFVLLIWINEAVLLNFFNSADEQSCFFLAQLLSRGRFLENVPAFGEFFQTPHIGMLEGKWFSVYPPGWPLIWALFIKFGLNWHWLNPLLAAAAVRPIARRAERVALRAERAGGVVVARR